jgi:mRNA interferase MazF
MRNLFSPGDVVVLDFHAVTGVKCRPTVVISSTVYHASTIYHASRPDVVVGLITSQTIALGPTDYLLQDWAQVQDRGGQVVLSDEAGIDGDFGFLVSKGINYRPCLGDTASSRIC